MGVLDAPHTILPCPCLPACLCDPTLPAKMAPKAEPASSSTQVTGNPVIRLPPHGGIVLLEEQGGCSPPGSTILRSAARGGLINVAGCWAKGQTPSPRPAAAHSSANNGKRLHLPATPVRVTTGKLAAGLWHPESENYSAAQPVVGWLRSRNRRGSPLLSTGIISVKVLRFFQKKLRKAQYKQEKFSGSSQCWE